MKQIDIAYSPCPNDTFIFYGMTHNKIDCGNLNFTPHHHDIEELNTFAFNEQYPLTKLSFFAYLKLRDKYELLNTGAALGHDCGPLIISRKENINPAEATIAIPGEFTTASLLLHLWADKIGNVKITRFDKIIDGVKNSLYDAGVIIHEGRFVYQDFDLKKIIDLGEWWEQSTGTPIPLGCIAIKKQDPIYNEKEKIESMIRDSINYSYEHPKEPEDYIKAHSQELDDDVIKQHINLYVNNYSLDLGEKGREAIRLLEQKAFERGIK